MEAAEPALQEPSSDTSKLAFNRYDLSIEQETCLKKRILSHAVNIEADKFGEDPTEERLLQDTVLMSLVYREFILACPMFKKSPKVLADMKQFVSTYPRLSGLARKATKSSSDATYGFFASLLDIGFRTPKQVERDAKWTEVYSRSLRCSAGAPVADADLSYTAMDDFDPHESTLSRETLEGMQVVFQDLLANGGAQRLQDIFRAATTIDKLPPVYRRVLGGLVENLLPKIEREMKDPAKVSRANMFYSVMPRKAIYYILQSSNPLKKLSLLTDLLLGRPFNAKNLLQRMCEIIAEVGKTESLVDKARKTVPKKLAAQVKLWAAQGYEPDAAKAEDSTSEPHHVTEDDKRSEKIAALARAQYVLSWHPGPKMPTRLRRSASLPTDTSTSASALGEKELLAVYELILLEERLKDKQAFVQLLGDSEWITLVKSILPSVIEPFAESYQNAGMGKFIEGLFELIHNCAKVPKKAGDNTEQRRAGYRQAIEQFEECLYQFERNIIVHDSGTVKALLDWALVFYQKLCAINFDLYGFLNQLSDEAMADVIAEVDAYIAWKKQKREAMQSSDEEVEESHGPPTPAIGKHLAVPFLEFARRLLSSPIGSADASASGPASAASDRSDDPPLLQQLMMDGLTLERSASEPPLSTVPKSGATGDETSSANRPLRSAH